MIQSWLKNGVNDVILSKNITRVEITITVDPAILIKNNKKNFALIFVQFSALIVIIILTMKLNGGRKFSEITVQKT